MTESELSRKITEWADRNGVFWQRFEDAAQPGIPDGYLGLGGVGHGWVELKQVASATEKPAYRPGQLPWAVRAAERGQRPVTLSVGADGMLRVTDTAAVGRAEAFGRDWPQPFHTSFDLDSALVACMGLRRLPWL